MHEELEQLRDRFIEETGRLGESVGLNRMTCQLYGLLYLEDGPISLTELSRTLHISKGSASLNIRKLAEWGAVRLVWRKGSNQNYYQANRDIWQIVRKRLKSGLDKRLSGLEETLAVLTRGQNGSGRKERLSPEETRTLKMYRGRLKEVSGLLDRTRQLAKLFS